MSEPLPQAPKPGYKTTEFWLTAIVTILGLLTSSGAIGEESMVAKIIGGAMAVLATMGYSASRATTKKIT